MLGLFGNKEKKIQEAVERGDYADLPGEVIEELAKNVILTTESTLADWRNYEVWESDGARTATERATELWQQRLREYQEPVLEAERREEIEAYVARRKEEIRQQIQ